MLPGMLSDAVLVVVAVAVRKGAGCLTSPATSACDCCRKARARGRLRWIQRRYGMSSTRSGGQAHRCELAACCWPRAPSTVNSSACRAHLQRAPLQVLGISTTRVATELVPGKSGESPVGLGGDGEQVESVREAERIEEVPT